MSGVRRRLPLGRALWTSAVLAATIPCAMLPVATLAAPSYTVDSNLDFPKLGGSGASCQSTAPGNPCTLRAAIETANAGGSGATIEVPAGLGTIVLDSASGALPIQVGMAIRATGVGSPKIDGGNATTDLSSGSPDPVTLSGLTLQGSNGGALLNVGRQLTLNGVTVTGNHVNHAVFSTGGLTSNGSNVTGNFDGGMALIGATTLNNTNVTHNGNLGGVFSTNAPLTLNGGSVSDNVEAAGDGGGLVAFNLLTVTGTSFSRNAASGVGGGLDVVGTATLTDVKITDNSAQAGGAGLTVDGTTGLASATIASSTLSGNSSLGDGGGIGVVGATLTVTGSTLNGNRTELGAGGGIAAIDSTTSLTNDTLTGNTAPSIDGGGIAQERFTVASTRGQTRPRSAAAAMEKELGSVRAILARYNLPAASVPQSVKPAAVAPRARPDDVTMESVTLSGNSAAAGGGISNAEGLAFTVHGSILANNNATGGEPDCQGSVTSAGYNLESAAECVFTAAGDKQRSNPQLLPLGPYGGPTSTMALSPGSPAIDAGDPACPPPATDQRGVSRPQGARCDIGAFESVPTAAVSLPAPPDTGHPPVNQPAWVRLTALAGILAIMVLISVTVAVGPEP